MQHKPSTYPELRLMVLILNNCRSWIIQVILTSRRRPHSSKSVAGCLS